jgi:hypothetical protein
MILTFLQLAILSKKLLKLGSGIMIGTNTIRHFHPLFAPDANASKGSLEPKPFEFCFVPIIRMQASSCSDDSSNDKPVSAPIWLRMSFDSTTVKKIPDGGDGFATSLHPKF